MGSNKFMNYMKFIISILAYKYYIILLYSCNNIKYISYGPISCSVRDRSDRYRNS